MPLSQRLDWKCWPLLIDSLESQINSSKREGYRTWVLDATPILDVASDVGAVQLVLADLAKSYLIFNCYAKFPFLGSLLGMVSCFIDFYCSSFNF